MDVRAETCRRMGIGTVAVFSEADADAKHTRWADEAYCVGGPNPQESYLDIQAVLDAIAASGAEAVHPGYGFLSENVRYLVAMPPLYALVSRIAFSQQTRSSLNRHSSPRLSPTLGSPSSGPTRRRSR